MPHGYMRHPPVRRVPWVTSKKRLEDMSWDVHDLGAHSEEDLGGLVLREEVREVVDGAHVRDDDLSFLDDFAALMNNSVCKSQSDPLKTALS